MKKLWWMRAVLLWSAVAVIPAAQAAPCAGFTDVDSTSPFCQNIEWIKNRGITLGCTSATTFCPTSEVTRFQMAAFLNRLGTALTPEYVLATDSAINVSLASPVPVCLTTTLNAATYPRRAALDSTVNVYNSATSQGVAMRNEVSNDGGATWTGLAETYHYISNVPSIDEFTAPVGGNVNIVPGTSYQFRIVVFSYQGTAGNAWIGCRLRVRVDNRQGTSSPFDIQAGPFK